MLSQLTHRRLFYTLCAPLPPPSASSPSAFTRPPAAELVPRLHQSSNGHPAHTAPANTAARHQRSHPRPAQTCALFRRRELKRVVSDNVGVDNTRIALPDASPRVAHTSTERAERLQKHGTCHPARRDSRSGTYLCSLSPSFCAVLTCAGSTLGVDAVRRRRPSFRAVQATPACPRRVSPARAASPFEPQTHLPAARRCPASL